MGAEDQVKDAAHSFSEDFAKLRSDVMSAVKEAVGYGKSQAGVAKQKFSEGTDALKGQYEQAKDAGIDGVRSLEDKIEKNPLAAVAIAAGVGLIVGGLLRRK